MLIGLCVWVTVLGVYVCFDHMFCDRVFGTCGLLGVEIAADCVFMVCLSDCVLICSYLCLRCVWF